jgi:hypothetical protein
MIIDPLLCRLPQKWQMLKMPWKNMELVVSQSLMKNID